MARVAIPITVQTPTGDAVAGASVTVKNRSDNTNATVYQSETGGTTTANPLATDASGRVTGWVDRGAYNLVVTGGSITGYTEPWDAAPAEDNSVDTEWLAQGALPIGFIGAYAGSADPAGGSWMICDGRAISRTTYESLFAAIGQIYGPGDGATTFNLPDMRGRVPVGKGTHVDVDTLGESDGLAVGNRKIKHRHGKGSLAVAGYTSANGSTQDPSTAYRGNAATSQATQGSDVSGEVGDLNGPLDAPAHLVMNFVIRVK